MNNYYFPSKTAKSREGKASKSNPIAEAFQAMLGERNNPYAQFRAGHKAICMDVDLKKQVDSIILAAHKADDKIEVKKKGTIRDSSGGRYDGFAFEAGRYRVGEALYAGIVVYQPSQPGNLHLLLLRSDQPQFKAVKFFPELGTAKDWDLMRSCMKRHSPKWASQQMVVDIPDAQSMAAAVNAAAILEAFGRSNAASLETLGGMSAVKLHLLDLFCIAALYRQFPPELHPEFANVLVIRSNDDLDELRRVARAWDLTVPREGFGHEFPVIELTQVGDLAAFKQADRFVLTTYSASEIALKVIGEVDRLRATSQGTGEFAKAFPSPPVLVGSSIWSKRSCVEIDLRDVRFEDRELEVGRVLIAELVQKRNSLMEGLRTEWAEFSRHSDILLMSPDRVWFQCFHYAASAVLFPAHFTRAEFQNIVLEADAARLRLREDREARYKRAMNKIREATAETSWVEPNKPKTKEEALELLKGEKAAFLYYPRDIPSLCFTKASLRRLADLGEDEMNDFIAKLQCNRFEVDPSHPVTFAKGEQQRMIRVRAESVSVTKNRGDENGTQSGS